MALVRRRELWGFITDADGLAFVHLSFCASCWSAVMRGVLSGGCRCMLFLVQGCGYQGMKLLRTVR